MSQAEKNALLAELAHGINSPLAAIRNALYLAECCSDPTEVRRYLRIADSEVSAITAVLSEALQESDRTQRSLALAAIRKAAA